MQVSSFKEKVLLLFLLLFIFIVPESLFSKTFLFYQKMLGRPFNLEISYYEKIYLKEKSSLFPSLLPFPVGGDFDEIVYLKDKIYFYLLNGETKAIFFSEMFLPLNSPLPRNVNQLYFLYGNNLVVRRGQGYSYVYLIKQKNIIFIDENRDSLIDYYLLFVGK